MSETTTRAHTFTKFVAGSCVITRFESEVTKIEEELAKAGFTLEEIMGQLVAENEEWARGKDMQTQTVPVGIKLPSGEVLRFSCWLKYSYIGGWRGNASNSKPVFIAEL